MIREPAVIAVDVGGTTIKSGLVTHSGELLYRQAIPTPARNSVEAVIGSMTHLQRIAKTQGFDIVAAGIITPGMVDASSGVVAYASNLAWRDVPLAALASASTRIPVYIDHDVRSAGLAESKLGDARGLTDVFFPTIGTGVAAAILADSRALTGSRNAAGEFGHIPVVMDGERCACGQRGCLEVYMSGAGISRRYFERSRKHLTSQEIVQVLASDPTAKQVWSDGVDALAHGLATVTLLLDPARIVIGGGFSSAGEALLDPLRTRLSGLLTWREAPSVTVSVLGSRAGVLGAAIHAFTRCGYADVAGRWVPNAVG